MTKARTNNPPLVRIVCEQQKNGTWRVTRERAENGESAVGLGSWQECFEYVKAHDWQESEEQGGEDE